MPDARKDDELVPFRGKGTIYRGIGAPWAPGSTPYIPKSHADALTAGGHAAETEKSAKETEGAPAAKK